MEMLLGAHRTVPGAAMMQRKFHTFALWAIVSTVCVAMLLHYSKNSSLTYLTERSELGNENNQLSKTVTDMEQFWDINSEFQSAQEVFEAEPSLPIYRSTTLGPCPDTPSNLVGPLRIEFHLSRTWSEVRKEVGAPLQDGGRYMPRECLTEQKVGVKM